MLAETHFGMLSLGGFQFQKTLISNTLQKHHPPTPLNLKESADSKIINLLNINNLHPQNPPTHRPNQTLQSLNNLQSIIKIDIRIPHSNTPSSPPQKPPHTSNPTVRHDTPPAPRYTHPTSDADKASSRPCTSKAPSP